MRFLRSSLVSPLSRLVVWYLHGSTGNPVSRRGAPAAGFMKIPRTRSGTADCDMRDHTPGGQQATEQGSRSWQHTAERTLNGADVCQPEGRPLRKTCCKSTRHAHAPRARARATRTHLVRRVSLSSLVSLASNVRSLSSFFHSLHLVRFALSRSISTMAYLRSRIRIHGKKRAVRA